MAIELDNLDRKLVAALSADARQPVSQIAKHYRVGRDVIDYRLEKLQDQGVIRRLTTVINPYKLGFVIYKTYFRLATNRKRIQALVTFAKNHPRAYWIAECHGSWDMIISVFASHPSEFHHVQDQILSKFNDIILGFSVYTLIDVIMYRKPSFGGQLLPPMAIGGNPENHILDELELTLLRLLSENARTPVTQLAEQTNVTPIMVKNRIERLEERGIISGYRCELDLALLGLAFFKAQLDLQNHTTSEETKLEAYCHRLPQVRHYIRQIGEQKLELELEVNNFEDYNSILEEAREEFSSYIRHIDSILLSRDYFSWTPTDLASVSP